MAGFFVDGAGAGGLPVLHARDHGTPGAEFLGRFQDSGQALALARLKYPGALRCHCCRPAAPVSRPRPHGRSRGRQEAEALVPSYAG